MSSGLQRPPMGTASQPVPELFDRVVALAERRGRVPVGQWTVELSRGWTLKVNGGGDEWDGIPPYHAGFFRNDWLVLLVTVNGGTMIGTPDSNPEDELLDVLNDAIAMGVC